ncbi:hypothetical protein [Verrucosispora sp. WMMC514]|uniref:hypothetical protein n=1 Tax=Verrucosispora sp. WMMC514 TaxID=3015156 RepID=UPI00248C7747|nr:hypothetical protein [Verrucosispora sp. WMMC514]WBB94251.1 hypothetical protein O7597_15480 [Verrucosispora sp. WMMC514]
MTAAEATAGRRRHTQQIGLAAHFRRLAHETETKAADGDATVRDEAAREADELRRRADAMTGEWPMRAWTS